MLGFLDLPRELHAKAAAELELADFCALRQTCCELARLPLADYATARSVRATGWPYPVVKAMLGPLFQYVVGAFASAEASTQHALLAALVGCSGIRGYLLAKIAARCGQIYVLDWLDAHYDSWHISRAAARGGDIAVFRWLRAHDWPVSFSDAACAAARHNRVDMFAFLLAARPKLRHKSQVVVAACRSGSMPMLDALGAGFAHTKISRAAPTVFAELAKRGNIAALDWLSTRGLAPLMQKESANIARAAVAQNQCGVVGWLAERGFCKYTGDLLVFLRETAAGAGACHALDWLFLRPEMPPIYSQVRCRLAEIAAYNARTQVLDWLLARGLDRYEFTGRPLRFGATEGHAHVLAWAVRRLGCTAADFARYAGCHEATDAFLAELRTRAEPGAGASC